MLFLLFIRKVTNTGSPCHTHLPTFMAETTNVSEQLHQHYPSLCNRLRWYWRTLGCQTTVDQGNGHSLWQRTKAQNDSYRFFSRYDQLLAESQVFPNTPQCSQPTVAVLELVTHWTMLCFGSGRQHHRTHWLPTWAFDLLVLMSITTSDMAFTIPFPAHDWSGWIGTQTRGGWHLGVREWSSPHHPPVDLQWPRPVRGQTRSKCNKQLVFLHI